MPSNLQGGMGPNASRPIPSISAARRGRATFTRAPFRYFSMPVLPKWQDVCPQDRSSVWTAADYFGCAELGLTGRLDLPIVVDAGGRPIIDPHQPPGCLQLLDEIVSVGRGLRQFQLLEFLERLRPMAFPTPFRPAFQFPQRISALADPGVFIVTHNQPQREIWKKYSTATRCQNRL
ncbi:hypothetical protein RHECNPAF_4460029 [Rhizobium etli CNPAF512]|nr:hypothetical protein RHECNPAF_4460029 [Rhizobium etli CNPAF512]